MKKFKSLAFIYPIAFSLLLFSSLTFSRTINVSVSNFNFSPAAVTNAIVGDTIQWTRIAGSHTTTCNGTNGTTRPPGASPWDAPLNSGNTSFKYVIQVAGTYNYVCTPHAPDMAGTIIATISSISQITEKVNTYKISQNYPNPFNPVTSIKFSVPNNAFVTLKVYNSAGAEIETLVNENLNASSYEVVWNAEKQSSGIYYYKIQSDNFTETKKMMLVK